MYLELLASVALSCHYASHEQARVGKRHYSLFVCLSLLLFACKAFLSLYYIMKTCDLKTNTGGKKTSGIPPKCNAFLRRSMLSFMWDDEVVLCDSCAEKPILLQHEAVRIWPRLTLSQKSGG